MTIKWPEWRDNPYPKPVFDFSAPRALEESRWKATDWSVWEVADGKRYMAEYIRLNCPHVLP